MIRQDRPHIAIEFDRLLGLRGECSSRPRTLPFNNPPAPGAADFWRLNLGQKKNRGKIVAIAAGSRGVANIALIIKAAVEHLKSLGAEPFIVPWMGSHGGGT